MPTDCIAQDDSCPGISGLYFGQLPCFACWVVAPDSAIAAHKLWGHGPRSTIAATRTA
jgi:hypothetical protein